MLQPDITHSYWLKDAHAYYHEGLSTLHIITGDGEITLENLEIKTLRNALKNRTKKWTNQNYLNGYSKTIAHLNGK